MKYVVETFSGRYEVVADRFQIYGGFVVFGSDIGQLAAFEQGRVYEIHGIGDAPFVKKSEA